MPLHRRVFSLDRNIAQIEFNKSIAGCYRDGNAEYDSVGVLLLTWREDDMNCKEKEVNELERVFRHDFNFKTEQYEIPPTNTEESLFSRLQAFSRCYDSPSKLGIIYYGGHAERKENDAGVDLELFARRTLHGAINVGISRTNTSLSDISIPESPVDAKSKLEHPSTAPRPDQPHVSFKAICDKIKSSETDMLLIIDSCFAAGAFTDQPFSSRKCELFCSIAEKDWARAPGQEGSFTKILTSTLKKMIAKHVDGFSTSDLYRQVYLQQHQAHKPFHFVQSRFDFGKIWLRPCRPKSKAIEVEPDSKYTIDLRFHLTRSLDMVQLNRLVKALQWIPFVQRVKLQNMHGPNDDLSEFIRTVYLAKRLRPALARIRRKLELKRARQLVRTDSSPHSPTETTTSERFHVHEPRDIKLFDWSKAEAVMNDQRFTSDQYMDKEDKRHGNRENSVKATTAPVQRAVADVASQALRQEGQPDEIINPDGSLWQRTTRIRPSQRALDGLLFFSMGVLAPTVLGWVVQGSALPPLAAL